MMKHLLLMRHGTAAHSDSGSGDFGRALSPKGHNECKMMGALAQSWFTRLQIDAPELILSSPARRTSETVIRIAQSLNYNAKAIEYEEILYLPSIEECLEVIWAQGSEMETLVICSHNPGITSLANHLFGGLPSGLYPCGMALGRLNIDDWPSAQRGTGELLEFKNP